jgi:hypothetical protein
MTWALPVTLIVRGWLEPNWIDPLQALRSVAARIKIVGTKNFVRIITSK